MSLVFSATTEPQEGISAEKRLITCSASAKAYRQMGERDRRRKPSTEAARSSLDLVALVVERAHLGPARGGDGDDPAEAPRHQDQREDPEPARDPAGEVGGGPGRTPASPP